MSYWPRAEYFLRLSCRAIATIVNPLCESLARHSLSNLTTTQLPVLSKKGRVQRQPDSETMRLSCLCLGSSLKSIYAAYHKKNYAHFFGSTVKMLCVFCYKNFTLSLGSLDAANPFLVRAPAPAAAALGESFHFVCPKLRAGNPAATFTSKVARRAKFQVKRPKANYAKFPFHFHFQLNSIDNLFS